jgi:prepilin-type N-terminal cleavage/methylation domain-containing protein
MNIFRRSKGGGEMMYGRVISAVRRTLRKEHGFSFMELMIAALIIAILIAVVILFVTGFFGEARETGLESELRNMKTAVDAYIIQAFEWPTEDGNAPLPGEYALIDFEAGFMQDGQMMSFYPHFIDKLPPHWDEGVWRLDSAARVSLDMDPEEY